MHVTCPCTCTCTCTCTCEHVTRACHVADTYHGSTLLAIPGSYGRVLRLSPEGLATLTPDMTPRLTNLWKIGEIAEVAPHPLACP
jgi:hypothetical protein